MLFPPPLPLSLPFLHSSLFQAGKQSLLLSHHIGRKEGGGGGRENKNVASSPKAWRKKKQQRCQTGISSIPVYCFEGQFLAFGIYVLLGTNSILREGSGIFSTSSPLWQDLAALLERRAHSERGRSKEEKEIVPPLLLHTSSISL